MQNKLKNSFSISKLKKYTSESKFRFLHNHSLNKSPTKNVPSFKTGSLRLLEPKSFSPNKFYDLPQFKTKKSVSFGFGTKTNFAKKQFVEPTRYKISSSFDPQKFKKTLATSFGISRQDFYKGKFVKLSQKVGPGSYNLDTVKKKLSFQIGKKIKRKDQTLSPGPGAYNIQVNQTLQSSRLSSTLKLRAPRIKTQYFEKTPLERYDNKVPGPGAYDTDSVSMTLIKIKSNRKPKIPQGPRFWVKQQRIPGPGAQQFFLQIVNLFHSLEAD